NRDGVAIAIGDCGRNLIIVSPKIEPLDRVYSSISVGYRRCGAAQGCEDRTLPARGYGRATGFARRRRWCKRIGEPQVVAVSGGILKDIIHRREAGVLFCAAWVGLKPV